MSDDFIQQFEQPRPPRPEFSAALYQRITQPMKTTPRTRILRAAALSFAVVAVIAAVLFFSPSVRAFAESVIQQVTMKKGDVTIQPANDVAAASQLAGFKVLAPAYLPDGYTAEKQPETWIVSHANDGVMADISYANQAANGHISIVEKMYRSGAPRDTMNGAEKQAVTVRGQPGTWMPAGGKSNLTWEENGIAYMIIGSLSKNEALKIAVSLGKELKVCDCTAGWFSSSPGHKPARCAVNSVRACICSRHPGHILF